MKLETFKKILIGGLALFMVMGIALGGVQQHAIRALNRNARQAERIMAHQDAVIIGSGRHILNLQRELEELRVKPAPEVIVVPEAVAAPEPEVVAVPAPAPAVAAVAPAPVAVAPVTPAPAPVAAAPATPRMTRIPNTHMAVANARGDGTEYLIRKDGRRIIIREWHIGPAREIVGLDAPVVEEPREDGPDPKADTAAPNVGSETVVTYTPAAPAPAAAQAPAPVAPPINIEIHNVIVVPDAMAAPAPAPAAVAEPPFVEEEPEDIAEAVPPIVAPELNGTFDLTEPGMYVPAFEFVPAETPADPAPPAEDIAGYGDFVTYPSAEDKDKPAAPEKAPLPVAEEYTPAADAPAAEDHVPMVDDPVVDTPPAAEDNAELNRFAPYGFFMDGSVPYGMSTSYKPAAPQSALGAAVAFFNSHVRG